MKYLAFIDFLLFSAIAISAGLLGFLNFISFCSNKKESTLYNSIYLLAVYFIYLWVTWGNYGTKNF